MAVYSHLHLDTTNTWNRGYELLKSQMLEEGTSPELKEGYYIGDEIPKTHPYFINKKLNSGPNIWPSDSSLPDVQDFKNTSLEYYAQVVQLAKDILKVLALTLDLSEDYFDDFASGAVATMRLLHYPSQPPDSPAKLTRGIGAHTDFGCITILLQDTVSGLQVYDYTTKEWLDVTPTPGAFVINLGNLMMRWSNDRYISNLHRVINVSGEERYSIPVFFSGNPDYVVSCLPNCKTEGSSRSGLRLQLKRRFWVGIGILMDERRVGREMKRRRTRARLLLGYRRSLLRRLGLVDCNSKVFTNIRLIELLNIEYPEIKPFSLDVGVVRMERMFDMFEPFAFDNLELIGMFSVWLGGGRADKLKGSCVHVTWNAEALEKESDHLSRKDSLLH